MVLGGTKTRGVADNPNRVLRSGGWFLMMFGAFLLVAIGLLFAIAGAFAPVDEGEDRSWMPVALGATLAVFGVVLAVVMWGPRPGRPMPAPTTAPDGGIALPRRRSQHVAAVVGMVAVAVFGVQLAITSDGPFSVVIAVLVTAFGLSMSVLLIRSRKNAGGCIILTPQTVTLPAGTTPRTTIEWPSVVEVAAVGGWQPHLVVTYKGPGLATTRLLGQAWTPAVLIEVLEHFRTHATERAQLTSVDALARFRQ